MNSQRAVSGDIPALLWQLEWKFHSLPILSNSKDPGDPSVASIFIPPSLSLSRYVDRCVGGCDKRGRKNKVPLVGRETRTVTKVNHGLISRKIRSTRSLCALVTRVRSVAEKKLKRIERLFVRALYYARQSRQFRKIVTHRCCIINSLISLFRVSISLMYQTYYIFVFCILRVY